jgi:hypothetical protein
MSDIKVLIVVDGIFNLSTTYPYKPPNSKDSPDGWFTLSFLISALRNNPSPTFFVDTASRGFSVDGIKFPQQYDTADPSATWPTPSNPMPFRFDYPSVNLLDYDEIWLFGDLGYDGGSPTGPPFTDPQSGNPGEPGRLSDSELAKITEFMQAGGGVFAVGDHDGLGAGMCGFIPRVRYMRKWFDASDTSAGLPPSAAVRNWSVGNYQLPNGVWVMRMDTLVENPTYDINAATGEWIETNTAGDPVFLFDDQSDDIPQKLTVLVPSHPVVQGATGVLSVYPDHMHEGEVMVPDRDQLAWTSATDDTLSFAGPNFTEFPSVRTGAPPLAPIILARGQAGATPHGTNTAPDDKVCCNPFGSDANTCQQAQPAVLAAYDGHMVNVGRIVTDSSFHHFLDLNLLGDPCSSSDPTNVKLQGFNGSRTGKAVLNELKAFYVNIASWLAQPLARPEYWVYFQGTANIFQAHRNYLWVVNEDGSQQSWIGGQSLNSSPVVTPDGWVYYQGTDNRLQKIRPDGTGWAFLNNWCSSAPFVAADPTTGDQWVYYQGTDNRLQKVDTNGNQWAFLNNWSKSQPVVADDPNGVQWVYFQGTDNRLLRVQTDGTNTQFLNNWTNWIPCLANDPTNPSVQWVYFKGTDNRLLKVDTHGNQTQWLNNWTNSAPVVAADSTGEQWVYYQGTDNRLQKVDTNGNNWAWLNNWSNSAPFVPAGGGWVYFQGTDNRLLKVDTTGNNLQQIGDNTTQCTPFVSFVM